MVNITAMQDQGMFFRHTRVTMHHCWPSIRLIGKYIVVLDLTVYVINHFDASPSTKGWIPHGTMWL